MKTIELNDLDHAIDVLKKFWKDESIYDVKISEDEFALEEL